MMDVVVADEIVAADRDKHPGGLLAVHTDMVHVVIGDDALRRIIIDLSKVPRSSSAAVLTRPFLFNHVVFTTQTDRAVSRMRKSVATYRDPAIVVADKKGVAPHPIKEAIFY